MVAGHGRRARIPRRSIAPERQANGADTGGPSASAILVFSAVTALQPALPTYMARRYKWPSDPACPPRSAPTMFRDHARRGGLGTVPERAARPRPTDYARRRGVDGGDRRRDDLTVRPACLAAVRAAPGPASFPGRP